MTPKQNNSAQPAWVQLYMARRQPPPSTRTRPRGRPRRLVAFFSRSRTDQVPLRTTLRRLGLWCGLTHVRVHQLLKDPGHLTWFVRSRLGSISDRYGPRSEPTTYWFRAEIPLTLVDQARLVTCL